MAHTPYKNRKKEENFQRKRRLNPFTRAISTSVLNLLTPILIILVIVISSSCSGSGGAETQSSQAEITELAVTINGTDYPITFEADRTSTVSIPAAETIPGKITVKSAVISEKASGLQASDELAVTNNQASITITAEDGTKLSYTLSPQHFAHQK